MENQKQYMVVAYGHSKATNKPYSKALKIVTSKDDTYAYLSIKDVVYLDEIKPISSIVNASTTLTDVK